MNKMSLFLTKDLSSISQATANTIVKDTSTENKTPSSLNSSQIAALHQRLRDEKSVKDPSPNCLSPAGEYNLRLGILKELEPNMVATYTEKPASHEGHAIIVEAAVSLGGKKVREGINVYRFANRIPLLFEVGADVVTQVATKNMPWSTYHINDKTDRVGVFVSIVSTRIPFKGTSKEYVGEDVTELKAVVKKCLGQCCLQLKANLKEKKDKTIEQERKKVLIKYIPDISKSIFNVLQKIQVKDKDNDNGDLIEGGSLKRRKTSEAIVNGTLDSNKISSLLQKAVDKFEAESALQTAARESTSSSSKENRIKFLLTPYSPHSLPTTEHEAWTPVIGTNGAVKCLLNYDLSSTQLPPSSSNNFTAVVSASNGNGVPLSTTVNGIAVKEETPHASVRKISSHSLLAIDLTDDSPTSSSSSNVAVVKLKDTKVEVEVEVEEQVHILQGKRSRSILMALENENFSDDDTKTNTNKNTNDTITSISSSSSSSSSNNDKKDRVQQVYEDEEEAEFEF
jgi:hypothetical protein